MHKYLIIISFFAVISLPLILTTLNINLPVENIENRKLSPAPKISLKNIRELPNLFGLHRDIISNIKKYNAYYSDSFILKNHLFKLYVEIKSTLFKTNPLPSKVVEGKDGWMFVGNKYSDAILESKGILNFKEIELQQIKHNLNTWKKWFSEKKIDFYIAVPPNKLTIYGENLPIIFDKINKKKSEQFKLLCDSLAINHLDMFENHHNINGQLFSKTDTHWNDAGAYLAYQNLMSLIQINYPVVKVIPIDSFNSKARTFWVRDLTKMLSKKVREEEIFYEIKNSKAKPIKDRLTVPKTYSYNPDTYEIRFKSDANDLKVLIFRDSFSNALIKYIKESFGESVFIWKNKLNKEIINKENPDIVIAICVERSIDVFRFK